MWHAATSSSAPAPRNPLRRSSPPTRDSPRRRSPCGLEALESFSTLSLDAELATGDDGYSLGDTLGESDSSFDVVVDREAAKNELRRLPERERAILYMRFFEDMTQSGIADRLGISQMHVSRLITRSCAQVRDEALGQFSRSRSTS